MLHEIGHTLGLPHELDQRWLMNATYDVHASAFSPASVRLARRVLELRRSTLGSELHRSTAQAALNVLRSTPAKAFEAGATEEVARLLEWHAAFKVAPKGPATARTQLLPRAAPNEPLASTAATGRALPEGDRALLAKAQQAQAAGQLAEARALATPLFEKHPDVLAVQDLRCQLAMKAGLSMEQERAECAPLRRLSGF